MGALENVADAATSLLSGDERLVAAVSVKSKGLAMAGALGGAVGYGIARKVANRRNRKDAEKAEKVAFPLAPEMLIAATTERLLVWRASAMTGRRPKEFLGELPLSELSHVASAKSSLSPLGLALELGFNAADSLRLEGQRSPVKKFVAAVAPLVTAAG